MNNVKIIAEAGVNHNGKEDLAIKLIDEAVESGADIIKFQTFQSTSLVSEVAKKADYQSKNVNNSESQLEMLKRLELSQECFIKLKQYSTQKGIGFLSTAFDKESLDYLKGTMVNFTHNGLNKGIQFDNPNAKAVCGCGESSTI